MDNEFAGTSERGDLREAVSEAIFQAKESLTTDIIEWTLIRIGGLHGGFVVRDDLTVVISARVPDPLALGKGTRFEMTDASEPGRPFVIKILDEEKIEHARRILSGEERARVHVQGSIVKAPADFNPGWSFHVDPNTVDFFEFAIEVCDASIQYVEENLEEVGGSALPDLHWCPWSSRLVRELA